MYKTDLEGGPYSKRSTLAVKGSGPDFPIIILRSNYGGQDSKGDQIFPRFPGI